MRDVSSVFVILSLIYFHSAWRFRSNTQARAQSTQGTVATADNSTRKFDLLEFWDPPSESSNGEQYLSIRKRKEGHHQIQKAAKHRLDVSRKHRRGTTVNFRGRYEEEGRWPALRKQMTKTRRENILRSTRLSPLKLEESNDTNNVDYDEHLLYLNFNPASFKKTMEDNLRDIPGTNITFEVIGQTIEFNDIVLCKILPSKSRKSKYFRADEDKYVEEEPERRIILIVHGLSAMGFNKVPCLSNIRYFKKLLNMYLQHLDNFDIYLVPMANPDGIADYTLTDWNKNKSPQSACLGVALDRNFDVAWNESHSTSCNRQYPGPEAFSEIESRAIGDLMHLYSHKIVAYIHVHAGTYNENDFRGDAVLYPKGYTSTNLDDDKYMDLKGEIEDAIKTAGFRVMSVAVDTLYNWYGKVLGTSVDYASTVYGIPYALEFVMQVYDNDMRAKKSEEKMTDNVLTEIWQRVIDVVFQNIHKNTQPNDV